MWQHISPFPTFPGEACLSAALPASLPVPAATHSVETRAIRALGGVCGPDRSPAQAPCLASGHTPSCPRFLRASSSVPLRPSTPNTDSLQDSASALFAAHF